MRKNADYRDRCKIALAEMKKLKQRIELLLDAPNPNPNAGETDDWWPHDYKREIASIRRKSMELTQVLVDLRRPL